MTHFVQQGSVLKPTNEKNIVIHQDIPVGTYTVVPTMEGYVLEPIPHMELNGKIYGDVPERVNRVISTFNDRPGNTGILLKGEKGTGKTLFAKVLSAELRSQGIPTIVINQPLAGEQFNILMASITQPVMVFIDEFEKVYNLREQNSLLTLLDGAVASHKLFVITTNDQRQVSDYFINRPGRFYYQFNYESIDRKFVEEYCKDNLNDKDQVHSVVSYSTMFSNFNFDILKAIVEEMNRYKETVSEATKHLNASPLEGVDRFKVEKVTYNNELFVTAEWDDYACDGTVFNPFYNTTYVRIYTKNGAKEKQKINEYGLPDDDDIFSTLPLAKAPNKADVQQLTFFPKDIKKISGDLIYYENERGTLIVKKEQAKKFNIMPLIAFG